MAEPKPAPKAPPLDVASFFAACVAVGGGLAIALYYWPGHSGPPVRAIRRVR